MIQNYRYTAYLNYVSSMRQTDPKNRRFFGVDGAQVTWPKPCVTLSNWPVSSGPPTSFSSFLAFLSALWFSFSSAFFASFSFFRFFRFSSVYVKISLAGANQSPNNQFGTFMPSNQIQPVILLHILLKLTKYNQSLHPWCIVRNIKIRNSTIYIYILYIYI